MANNGRKRARRMDYILHDIVVDILSYLPVKSLTRFKCLSKQYYVLIANPDFIEQHLLKQRAEDEQILLSSPRLMKHIVMDVMVINGESSFEARKLICHNRSTVHDLPDDFYFMSHSCDGILCLHGYRYIHVHNPSTRELRTLPQNPRRIYHMHANRHYFNAHIGVYFCLNKLVGFGRDLVTKEYKVIRLFTPSFQDDSQECEIFTLNPDPKASWKSIGLVPYKINTLQRPVYINGAIYLLTDEIYHKSGTVIVMFDLHKEKFQVISHPKCCSEPSQSRRSMVLVSLRGRLCLAEQTLNSQLNIWIVEDFDTWEKLYSINFLLIELGKCFRFSIAEHKDGTILICGSKNKLYLYDQKDKSFSYETYGIGGDQLMSTTYIESLVPLYGTRLPFFKNFSLDYFDALFEKHFGV